MTEAPTSISKYHNIFIIYRRNTYQIDIELTFFIENPQNKMYLAFKTANK